jgi:2,5-diketo-D-gluconate reductase A
MNLCEVSVPTVILNDDGSIPQLGFGVFLVPPAQTQATVEQALEVGYRHLDTAQMYGNEAEVGAAIAASGIPREELWVTTKLNNGFHRPEDARRTFGESLARLRLEEVDLFLIHWPLPTRYDGDLASTWEALVGFREDGRARSIGVSNFEPDHLDRIVDATGVVPAVNQIEVHPFFGNEVARAAGARLGIVTEAWAPIARGKVNDDSTIGAIASRLDRTPAQVALRWHLQRGDVVFPKSTHAERMKENFAIFDFELGEADMATITGLDRGEDGRTGPNPNTFDVIRD